MRDHWGNPIGEARDDQLSRPTNDLLLFDPRKGQRMKRIIWLIVFAFLPQVPLLAQDMPDGVSRSVDTFTGDTVWETKYGRLDDPHGCKRSSLAIVWKLIRGPSGRTEWLTFQYIDITTPFHHSHWIGAVRAAINVDGRIIEGQEHPLSSHVGGSSVDEKTETGAYLMPDSTLRLVADGNVAKIRFLGTDRICDGTVEQNMKDRLHGLLQATR